MAKLADLRSNLSKEEKEEYEKFKTDPSKLKNSDTDDIEVVGEKTSSRGSPMEIDKGCYFDVKNKYINRK